MVTEIATSMKGMPYEMIFVNDYSTDGTLTALKALKVTHKTLRVLSHWKNSGQSRSVRSGVTAAAGDIIAMLDGDGQNDPVDIPTMFKKIIRKDALDNLVLVGGGEQNVKIHGQNAPHHGSAMVCANGC